MVLVFSVPSHSDELVADCRVSELPVGSQLCPHSFTAPVDRGWTTMARMCSEQLRIKQGPSPA